MPLEKTQEEMLASKINARNYSSILPVIYNLRKREKKDYFPAAPERIIYSPGVVGDGASKTFNSINASYSRGSAITLSGTATYILTDGTLITPSTFAKINSISDMFIGLLNDQLSILKYDCNSVKQLAKTSVLL